MVSGLGSGLYIQHGYHLRQHHCFSRPGPPVIVYSATKARFQQDVLSNDIGAIIFDTFRSVTGHSTNRSEINSWVNSLQCMDRVLNDPAIHADAGVAIEYHLPRSSKRIDFILTGKDAQQTATAIRPLPRIDNGKIKPSKNLADSLASMLRGNQEFVMVDDQKIVYETALAQARQAATGARNAAP